ncbi:hypothetical protein BDV96DRAFT_570317 [Lophiotrema nucula]|uniref:DUF7918 domain-containing protein n=1 Tax=Lophiotrema nucula TaxID=690887 RepID=A0A6A5ZGI8_9PLEO|nr:hypothetical protein BDV96DRAFT_570317 [Lophiotrema nucula]
MAILPGLESHFKVEIVSNGSPLEEYDDPRQGELQPGRLTKYIEAQSGATFFIQYSFLEEFPKTHHLAVQTRIDGKLVDSYMCIKARLHDPKPEVVDAAYSRIDGRDVRQGFYFSELMIADADGRAPNQENVKALSKVGEIEITFSFIKETEATEDTVLDQKHDIKMIGEVKEQDLKGKTLSHQASLGEPEVVDPQHVSDVKLLDRSPFGTFKFLYRSLARLQEEHVVPGPPPPTPPPTPLEERDIDTLTQDEMRELLKRQAERSAEAMRIKRERAEEEDEAEVVAKRQRVMDLQDEDGRIVIDD